MSVSRCLTLLSLAIFLVSGSSLLAPGEAHAKKSKSRSYSYRYLVPPPPAYMPSILPELQGRGRTQIAAKPKQDPVKKYIYTAPGYEDAKPIRANKNVTYWNRGPKSLY